MSAKGGFRCILAAVAVFAIACGDDAGTGPTNQSVAGTYTLRTVNGMTLPYTLDVFGSSRLELMNETLVVSANGTFTIQGTLRTTNAGSVTMQTYTDGGAYILSGTTGIFTFNSDGATGSAQISDGVITATFQAGTYVYRR